VKNKSKDEYKTLTVEAAISGWIVRETGRPAEIFVRWESFVLKLEHELTNKGLSGG
jgi:hypothetical protein